MRKAIGLLLIMILAAAGTILTGTLTSKAETIDYISLYSQQRGASWLGSDKGYSLGYWDKQLEPYGVQVKKYSWQGVSGRGCRLLSYAHAIQYLTGQKANETRMIEILAEFLRQNNDPPSANANVAYMGYVTSHYGGQYGITQVNNLDKNDWNKMTAHFDKGGVIVFSSVGHIALATGYCEKNVNNRDMKFIEIVDSAASATVSRTPSGKVYDFSSYNALTFSSFKVKDAAGHYWMNYEDFAQHMQIHAAFTSTTAQRNLNPLKKYTSEGIEHNGFYRVKAYRGSFREYPYSSAPVKGVFAEQNTGNVTEDDLFEVVDTVKNTEGEIFYRTANDWYVKPDEVEFLYRKQAEVDITAMTMKALLKEVPLAEARDSIGLGGLVQVKLTGKYINKQGEVWYRTEQGFIFRDHLRDMQSNAVITYENVTAPTGTLQPGKAFKLTGTIRASETITHVTARIVNADLWRIEQSKTIHPNRQTVEIGNTDIAQNGLRFENLPEGNYYYEVDVTTASGYMEFVDVSRFAMGRPQQPANVKVRSITLKIGNGLLLPGEEYRQYFYDDEIGDSFAVIAEVYPYDAANQSIGWSSSNSQTATVNAQNGTVTLKGPGVTTITATAKDGSGVSASFQIEVVCLHSRTNWKTTKVPTGTEEGMEAEICAICGKTLAEFPLPTIEVEVSEITMPGLETIRPGSSWYEMDTTERQNWAVLSLQVGDEYALNPTVLPADANCRDLLYEVYNSQIAEMDSRDNGTISAKRIGHTIIQIYAADGGGASAGILVSVNPKEWNLAETAANVGRPHEVTTRYNYDPSLDRDGYALATIHPAASDLYTVYAYGSSVANATINPDENGGPFEMEKARSGRNGAETLMWLEAGKSYLITVTEAERESGSKVIIGFRRTFMANDAIIDLSTDGAAWAAIPSPGQTAYFRMRSNGAGIYSLSSSGETDAVCTLYNACGKMIDRALPENDGTEENGFILSRQIDDAETVLYYGISFTDPQKTGTVRIRLDKHSSENMTNLRLNEDVTVPYDDETGIGRMRFIPQKTDYYLMHCWSDEPTVTLYDDAWRPLQEDTYPADSILQPAVYYLTANQTYYFEALQSGGYASTYYTIRQAVHAEEISVDNLELQPGESGEFSVTVLPDDTTNRTIIYDEESNGICDIGYDGTVTAKGAGICRVHARSEDNADAKDDALVIVHGPAEFQITGNNYVSEKGEITFHVQIITSDEDRYDGFEITMPEPRNDLIGWFDLTGATVLDRNGSNITDQVSIEQVNETAPGFRVNCRGISLNGTEFTVHMLDYNASDFTGQTLTIPVTTKLYIETEDGERTVLRKDITTSESITTTYPSELQIPIQHIYASIPVLLPGQSGDISCSYDPENATLKGVVFEETDNEVCKVTSDGHVTAKAGGTTTVHIQSTENPNVTGEATVTVLHGPVTARFNGIAEMNGDLAVSLTVYGSAEDSFEGVYFWIYSDAALELYDTKAEDGNGNRLGVEGYSVSEDISYEGTPRFMHIIQAVPVMYGDTYPANGTKITFRFRDPGSNAGPGCSNRYEAANLQMGAIKPDGNNVRMINSEMTVRYPDVFQETVSDFTLKNEEKTSTTGGRLSYEVTPAEMSDRIVFDEINNDLCEVTSEGYFYAKQNGGAVVTAHADDAPWIEREAILWIHNPFSIDRNCTVNMDGDIEMTFTLHGAPEDFLFDFGFKTDERTEDTVYTLAGCTMKDKNGQSLPYQAGMYHDYNPEDGEEGTTAFYIMHNETNYRDNRIPADGTVITFRIARSDVEEKWESTEQFTVRDMNVSYRAPSMLIPNYPLAIRSTLAGEENYTLTYPARRDVMNGADFVTPAELTSIEREAFAGARARRIRLGEKVSSIGSQAFSGCSLLTQIYIPPTCRSIAADAFDEQQEITIYGAENSYAEFYANRYGYGFHPVKGE